MVVCFDDILIFSVSEESIATMCVMKALLSKKLYVNLKMCRFMTRVRELYGAVVGHADRDKTIIHAEDRSY